MKKSLLLLISLLFAIIIGCEKPDDEEEYQHENPISFDGVEILYNVLPPGFYTRVCYISENIAYTTTSSGKIFKTQDGGYNWTQQNSGTELHLTDMFFFDDMHGYIVGYASVGYWESIILKTNDGGDTWIATNIQQSSLYNIYFIDENTGFAVGNKLFKTQDGGGTWDEVDLGYFSYGDINFFDGETGLLTAYALHSGNFLLKTIDGGDNWVVINEISPIGKMQINKGIVYLPISGSKILKTTDKGKTWQTLDAPSIVLGSSYFINELQAVVVGQHWYELGYFPNGLLCITNNGGKSWEKKHFPANEFYRINDIDFFNDSMAIAVGQGGCVLKIRF